MTQNFDHDQKVFGWNSTRATDCHSYALPKIYKLLPEGCKNVFDAGCGNGFISSKLLEKGLIVTGIDLSSDGILLAREKYPKARFEIRSVYDDLSDLAKNVDLVISSEVIEHLYYPQHFLINMFSIIRPGGWIIITTPYHGWLKNSLISILGQWDKHHNVAWEGGHIKFFSEKALKKLLREVGFDNIIYNNAGRIPLLWKSIVCRAQKSS